MGREIRTTEYYVRIDPERLTFIPEAERLKLYRETRETIVEQVKRHVDDVGHASVESEQETVCEFCGSPWTEADDSPHNGGCCDEDYDIYCEAAKALGEEAGS